MKIEEYIDTYYPSVDGVVVTVDNYTKWLNALGANCSVITAKTSSNPDNSSYKIYRFPSIPVVPKRGYTLSVPFLNQKLIQEVESNKPDIIHAHSPFSIGRLGLKIAKKNNIPIIATFHSKFYDDFYEATKSKILSKLLLKYTMNFFNKVDYVWTVNSSTAATLKSYGYNGKIEIFSNGTDLSKPENADSLIQDTIKNFNMAGMDIFLFVGQHIWQKNLRLIFESLALYKKSNSNFKLIMVGTGNIIDELKVLAGTLNISDNIIFAGKILDRNILTGIYLTADLFLFPSVYDNAPLVVREAAVCETPSLVIKDSGASERIVDMENGFLADENAESVCNKIVQAMSDKERLKQISINASKTIPIPWKDVVDTVYKRYEEIVEERKAKLVIN